MDRPETRYEFFGGPGSFLKGMLLPLAVPVLVLIGTVSLNNRSDPIIGFLTNVIFWLLAVALGVVVIAILIAAFATKKPTLTVSEGGVDFGKLTIPWKYIAAVGITKMGPMNCLSLWGRDVEDFKNELPPGQRIAVERMFDRYGVIAQFPDLMINGGARAALTRIQPFCQTQIDAAAPNSGGSA